jgi:hypothetical protein
VDNVKLRSSVDDMMHAIRGWKGRLWVGCFMFKQEVSKVGLSIEKGTDVVPDDGRFYVLLRGESVFSSSSQKAALAHYRQLRDQLMSEAGIAPEVPDPEETKRREREFYDMQAVRTESYQRREKKVKAKGGKGGRGGV